MTTEKISALIKLIESRAKSKARFDDEDTTEDVTRSANGDINEAYALGQNDGEIAFARQLKDFLSN